jgi:hypothetical protein
MSPLRTSVLQAIRLSNRRAFRCSGLDRSQLMAATHSLSASGGQLTLPYRAVLSPFRNPGKHGRQGLFHRQAGLKVIPARAGASSSSRLLIFPFLPAGRQTAIADFQVTARHASRAAVVAVLEPAVRLLRRVSF